MAHTSCAQDKQDYMHGRTHTHTNMYHLLLFRCNNDSRTCLYVKLHYIVCLVFLNTDLASPIRHQHTHTHIFIHIILFQFTAELISKIVPLHSVH
jgi:hypothetical protein